MHKIPEAQSWNRIFVASPIEKTRTMANLRAKQRQKRMPSSVLGAVDINDDGIVDDVELRLSKILRSVPGESHGLSPRSANKVRVKEGKKLMLKNFINKHGFKNVNHFAPQLCGDSLDSTIEKLSNSPCFKDDYRYLMVKAATYASQDGTAVKTLTRPFENAQRSVFLAAQAKKTEREEALFSSAAKNVPTRVDKSKLFRQKYEGVGTFKQQTVEILKNSYFRAAAPSKKRTKPKRFDIKFF